MDSLPRLHPARNPHYPSHDHEGTLIDYRDDPTAWATMPRYPRRVPQLHVVMSVELADVTCLDDAGDFTSPRPRYDAVFERPIPPGCRVELTVLDHGHATVIGTFGTIQEANYAAFNAHVTTFALRAVEGGRDAS